MDQSVYSPDGRQGRRKRYGRYGGRHTNPKFGMSVTEADTSFDIPYQGWPSTAEDVSFDNLHDPDFDIARAIRDHNHLDDISSCSDDSSSSDCNVNDCF